jgi:hypothetical protein
MATDNVSITMDSATQAFYKGVADGADNEFVFPASVDAKRRQAMYWLTIGRLSLHYGYSGDSRELAEYIRGASLRVPS